MIIMVTYEASGFDKHSQELSKRLSAKQFYSRRYFNSRDLPQFLEALASCEDVVHITNQNFARFAGVLQRPYIVTVHDLIRNFYDFDCENPEESEWLQLDEHFIKRAEKIIAVSDFTKRDIIRQLRIDAEKIHVIHNGLDHSVFRPEGPLPEVPYPYVLYVGSERPRKNLKRLIEALSIVRRQFPELRLVKVGEIGRDKSFALSWRKLAEELDVPVMLVGRVREEDLATWYRGARLLVYPSLLEGFGMPPVEAMACGCPVVVSDISVFNEVIGFAGIYVDPWSSDSISKGIHVGLERREGWVTTSLERAQDFSWDAAAKRTQDVYNEVELGLAL